MEERPVSTDIRMMHRRILQLEDLIRRIEVQQRASFAETESILAECHGLLSTLKIEFHEVLTGADEFAYERVPDIPIEDMKLKKAWLVLSKYHGGATADTVARDLKRHRTTVSTYLNTLVLMQFAQKERIGHEILYRAVLNREDGEG